jgi:hypothetical protein
MYPDDFEAPEADAAEQATDADPRDESEPELGERIDDEIPEWDAQEQSREVRQEDDYR